MNSLFEPMPVEAFPLGLRFPGKDVSLLEFGRAEAPLEETAQADEPTEPQRDEAAERALQVRAMVDAARASATAEARAEFDEELAAALGAEKDRMRTLETEFARERARYFAEAEGAVVRLALAIARKVLAREAAADGLHLEAIVKAALSRVQDGSTSTLRVDVGSSARWSEVFHGDDVVVIEDARMLEGEVRLETAVGQVELGVRPQMQEIERGLQLAA